MINWSVKSDPVDSRSTMIMVDAGFRDGAAV